MRYSNNRLSPVKKIGSSTYTVESKSFFNKQLKSQKTYVHYNNAVYMGGMVSYKRNSAGILLLDNGVSAIIDSNFDSYTDHNIFIRDNMIVSLLHLKKGSFELALRTSHFIFKIPFYDA